MDTEQSLLRHLLTAALVMFLICGFTVTPIAAAESGGAKMGWYYNINTTPVPPKLYELYEHYSEGIESAEHVLYKDLVESVPSTGYVAVTAAEIIEYLYEHPDITELKNGEQTYSAAEIIEYLQKHPDFIVYAPPNVLYCVELSGKFVTVDSAVVIDYLQNHPEFMGGSVDGHPVTADDITDYLQNHPDFAAGIYVASESYDDPPDNLLGPGPFSIEDVAMGYGIPMVVGAVLGLVASSLVMGDAMMMDFLLLLGCFTGGAIGLVVGTVMVIVNIVYIFIAMCDNGWEQVLVIPVLFALGTIIGSKHGLIKRRPLRQ